MTDQGILANTATLFNQRNKFALYAREPDRWEGLEWDQAFTRLPKALHDTMRVQPFSDGASRVFRLPDNTDTYIRQHQYAGAMGIRGIQPRVRKYVSDNL